MSQIRTADAALPFRVEYISATSLRVICATRNNVLAIAHFSPLHGGWRARRRSNSNRAGRAYETPFEALRRRIKQRFHEDLLTALNTAAKPATEENSHGPA